MGRLSRAVCIRGKKRSRGRKNPAEGSIPGKKIEKGVLRREAVENSLSCLSPRKITIDQADGREGKRKGNFPRFRGGGGRRVLRLVLRVRYRRKVAPSSTQRVKGKEGKRGGVATPTQTTEKRRGYFRPSVLDKNWRVQKGRRVQCSKSKGKEAKGGGKEAATLIFAHHA